MINRKMFALFFALVAVGLTLVLGVPRTQASASRGFVTSTEHLETDHRIASNTAKGSQVLFVPAACTSGNILQDPSFEGSIDGDPITNMYWESTSIRYGSELCSVARCGRSLSASPRTGNYWTWFGGASPEDGTLSQTVIIPSGATATLNYYLRIGQVTAPYTDTLSVKVDGTTLETVMEPSVADGNAFNLHSLNLSSFADGSAHKILFEYVCPAGGGDANFSVDDVTLDVLCPAATPTPTPTPTPSPSPSPNVVQFSSSNYNVQEDCTTLTITVNRLGDVSGAASVDYNTSEVTATEGKDYITALGRLQFAAGESSKTFGVLINEDSFVEGPETFNVNLSNPAGVTLGSPSIATVTITDDATEGAANPIDDPQNYVCQQYHDFLNRQPDASGQAFWTNEITSCGSNPQCIEIKRINVSAAFFLSIEFQQTGYFVERIYKSAYGDSSGNSSFPNTHQLPVPVVHYNEFLFETQQISRGVTVGQGNWEQQIENNKQKLTAEFVQRSRFITALPTSLTPTQFVDQLFGQAGVAPADSDRNAAISEFGGAANTNDTAARGRALRRVADNSMLTQQEFNRAFALMQYFGYLKRNPNDTPDADYTGYDFWLTKLNQFNGNFVGAEMVKAFITSSEYRQRFGPN